MGRGSQYTMGRGRNTMDRVVEVPYGVKIPRVGGVNIPCEGVHIPCIRGQNALCRGIKIP
jgi:hypothetical protein